MRAHGIFYSDLILNDVLPGRRRIESLGYLVGYPVKGQNDPRTTRPIHQGKKIEEREREIIETVTDELLIFLTRSIYSDGYVLKSKSRSLSSLTNHVTLETSTIGNDLGRCTLKDLIVIFQLANREIKAPINNFRWGITFIHSATVETQITQ